jgi:hypothetical protein
VRHIVVSSPLYHRGHPRSGQNISGTVKPGFPSEYFFSPKFSLCLDISRFVSTHLGHSRCFSMVFGRSRSRLGASFATLSVAVCCLMVLQMDYPPFRFMPTVTIVASPENCHWLNVVIAWIVRIHQLSFINSGASAGRLFLYLGLERQILWEGVFWRIFELLVSFICSRYPAVQPAPQ